ncbi:MAG: ORF6N domain-containing protein [candidate division Zixibacteria bacterium]|nr:ORF6N domain-containing protein [candidate division Zixibacteria bacterium]
MTAKPTKLTISEIGRRIYNIRGHRVMLDSDLAELYGVPTKRLNEQVKRNLQRFPSDFMFKLTAEETASLRSQFETSKSGRGGRRYLPYVFNEHGAIMLASVLNSERAIEPNPLTVVLKLSTMVLKMRTLRFDLKNWLKTNHPDLIE